MPACVARVNIPSDTSFITIFAHNPSRAGSYVKKTPVSIVRLPPSYESSSPASLIASYKASSQPLSSSPCSLPPSQLSSSPAEERLASLLSASLYGLSFYFAELWPRQDRPGSFFCLVGPAFPPCGLVPW